MRSQQFIAVFLALGATLVAALGTHVLHDLVPPEAAGPGAVDGGAAELGADDPDAGQRGLSGCRSRRPEVVATVAAGSGGQAIQGAGGPAHDEHNCVICRHLWNGGSVVALSSIRFDPQPVALWPDRYVSPHAPAVSVGWHSRGPPGAV